MIAPTTPAPRPSRAGRAAVVLTAAGGLLALSGCAGRFAAERASIEHRPFLVSASTPPSDAPVAVVNASER